MITNDELFRDIQAKLQELYRRVKVEYPYPVEEAGEYTQATLTQHERQFLNRIRTKASTMPMHPDVYDKLMHVLDAMEGLTS